MPDQLPPPSDAPRPWYRTTDGILHLFCYGLACVVTALWVWHITQTVPRDEFQRIGALVLPFLMLGVVVAIPIAVAIYNRRGSWGQPDSPVVNFFAGVVLFGFVIFGVYVLFAIVCWNV